MVQNKKPSLKQPALEFGSIFSHPLLRQTKVDAKPETIEAISKFKQSSLYSTLRDLSCNFESLPIKEENKFDFDCEVLPEILSQIHKVASTLKMADRSYRNKFSSAYK